MYVNARAIIEQVFDNRDVKILLQLRNKPFEKQALEIPGGRIEEYESIVDGLKREIYEETGLEVSKILNAVNRLVWESTTGSTYELLTPFFVYQTLEGVVDSTGYIFRCNVSGKYRDSDESKSHTWLSVSYIEDLLREKPETFCELTQSILSYYVQWRKSNS